MKINPSTILVFGHNQDLLATRQWVLETRGYRVLTVTRFSELLAVSPESPIRLLLLCHSLSFRERQAATSLASKRWRSALCHAMSADSARGPTGILGRLMHTCEGPAQLIGLVSGLLGETPAPVITPRSGLAA